MLEILSAADMVDIKMKKCTLSFCCCASAETMENKESVQDLQCETALVC